MAVQIPVSFEFRSNQTFANFLPGANLELISRLETLMEVADEQQLIIWGKKGSGKTHLLHACCQLLQQQGHSVFYLDLAGAGDPAVLEGLEYFELVCLDDLDQIAGQSAWEMALFGLHNQLRQQGHKLLIASQQAINTLPITLPDLKTRLNWGLAFKLQPLGGPDLLAALQLKARYQGFDLPDKVGRFLLGRYSHDFLLLSSLLEELDNASLSAQRKLTIPFLKQILAQRSVSD